MATLCFPATAEFGDLSLDEVLVYHDGPRLFSCRNLETGERYIAVWAGDKAGTDIWLVAPAAHKRIERLKKGELDVREIFTSPSGGSLFKVSVAENPGTTSVERMAPSLPSEDLLPEPGVRLSTPATPVGPEAVLNPTV